MKRLVLIVMFVCMTNSSHAAWTQFIGYCLFDNSLYRLSGSAFQSTKIGKLPISSYPITNASGLLEISENLAYMTERVDDILYTVNLNDASIVATVHIDRDMEVNGRGLALSPDGVLYGMFSGNELRTINPQTGKTTFLVDRVGGEGLIESIVFSSEGILYCGTDSGKLYKFDINTGSMMLVSQTICSDIDELTFAPDGYLYAIDSLGTPANIYRIDPSTGISVDLGTTDLPLSGLIAIPEPATISLISLGLLALTKKKNS